MKKMKKMKKIILTVLTVIFTFISCEKDDAIEDVNQETEHFESNQKNVLNPLVKKVQFSDINVFSPFSCQSDNRQLVIRNKKEFNEAFNGLYCDPIVNVDKEVDFSNQIIVGVIMGTQSNPCETDTKIIGVEEYCGITLVRYVETYRSLGENVACMTVMYTPRHFITIPKTNNKIVFFKDSPNQTY